MFQGWDNFYLLVGSAAGALVGIMFIVITLTAGYESKNKAIGSRVYNTPIVFHFSVILSVSIISAVPGLPIRFVTALLVICAAIGLAYSLTTTIRMIGANWQPLPDLSDKLFYGVFPSLAYLVLGVASLLPAAPFALDAIGASMLAMLLIGIRNAWDLATYFVLHPYTPGAGKRKS